MKFLFYLFSVLAILALYGQFRWGISYSPFYFKQNTIYFAFQFLLCTAAALGFYIAAKEEEKENKGE